MDLVSAIPAGTGMAFVLIQHLDPRHDSMLVNILAGATTIPVQEVTDGMQIEGDHIYVIPPDAELTIQSAIVLQLVSSKAASSASAAGHFFRFAGARTASGSPSASCSPAMTRTARPDFRPFATPAAPSNRCRKARRR